MSYRSEFRFFITMFALAMSIYIVGMYTVIKMGWLS